MTTQSKIENDEFDEFASLLEKDSEDEETIDTPNLGKVKRPASQPMPIPQSKPARSIKPVDRNRQMIDPDSEYDEVERQLSKPAPIPTRQETREREVREVRQEAPQQRTERPVENTQVAEEKSGRYVPYMVPAKFGLLDNASQAPIFEVGDNDSLIMALLTEILNRVERIEQSL